ncbi:MAG: hypothetical protein JXM70_26215 [Pirellulales bacterium]|nr:hypothetical protein [Pirellulales bacterium]
MNHSAPHFRLFSESNAEDQPGRWRFRLQKKLQSGAFSDENSAKDTFEAGGTEPDVRGERLELLCVVRGLEALDQPSRVTLITESAYVREGIRYGLEQWRANGWRWESFGRMVPVKNQDLWQRVDAAMRFHQLECQVWRFDGPHDSVPAPTQRANGKSQTANKLRPSSSDDRTAVTFWEKSTETEVVATVMPQPTMSMSRHEHETRQNLLRFVIMRWLAGFRAKILDGAAQIRRAVRV